VGATPGDRNRFAVPIVGGTAGYAGARGTIDVVNHGRRTDLTFDFMGA
jgi:hypothetical protein